MNTAQKKSAPSFSLFKSLQFFLSLCLTPKKRSQEGFPIASPKELCAESKLSTASAIASGTVLGTYEDTRFKSESKKLALKSVDILGLGIGSDLEKKLKYTEDVCSGIILGKELVNAPANVLTPEVLAEEASKIASMYNDVFSATILNVEQCKELKMGSYLGVAAASENPPHFIHLCYKPPGGSVKPKLALVGKGLTFDRREAHRGAKVCGASGARRKAREAHEVHEACEAHEARASNNTGGGYDIKTGPVCLIELMKFDMGGSAAVLGAAKALGQIKPARVEVHFIIAACENMISGTGLRPGDILTASNGKTIEVVGTRSIRSLSMCFVTVYCRECLSNREKEYIGIVDLATLTGACRVALGPLIAGIFTPSDDLASEVIAASEVSGEKLWRLPLEESYWESMKSGVADMVNTGGRQGGAITAALFLKQFVDEKVQWMHIDMAGPVWNDKKKAATGFGISTLVEWVLKNSS
ncbi:Leucine aminopeptidase [Actinidia chinensis var. chinensis]|uniref:Leucine aminopeptidase n=1 Tax=Actinidia chinensis var. chinensis TaxID=1590841 RepID=A0A2R6QHP1_ACTCC|nr:Leucine aminopeptidase [Actinidia chinensis var. chinensis]